MLSGFPASAATDPDMAIRAYLMAVEGIAQEAVARAARLFITGQVKDHNRDFAPSCASFAEQCRYQQAAIEVAARPRIELKQEPAPAPPVDPRKLKLLNAALQGDVSATEELKRMYPDLPVWRMADLPVSKLMESE
ncbi:hypothetical protein LPB79_13135 [Rhizobium sp. T136]|uniref:hypothetical protein n=1 Tax=Rhizobium sp. T136 TaxID=555319 RepID=UPI001E2AB8B7|nr:hypothetical protein [Rhizobium sp. T136]UFS83191.1 hypothetical protein LPB79_13135 [Rhizobium sp. T136]